MFLGTCLPISPELFFFFLERIGEMNCNRNASTIFTLLITFLIYFLLQRDYLLQCAAFISEHQFQISHKQRWSHLTPTLFLEWKISFFISVCWSCTHTAVTLLLLETRTQLRFGNCKISSRVSRMHPGILAPVKEFYRAAQGQWVLWGCWAVMWGPWTWRW